MTSPNISRTKVERIPFVVNNTKRIETGGLDLTDEPKITGTGKDSIYMNVIPVHYGNKNVLIKKPGYTTTTVYSGEHIAVDIMEMSFTANFSSAEYITTWNDGSVYYTIPAGTSTKVGSTGSELPYLSRGFIGGKDVILISEWGTTAGGTGWYWVDDAGAAGVTFTGDVHNGTAIIDNISSTTGMYSGQPLSGTGIPASTRILTVDSTTQITMNANGTASNNTVTVTRDGLAKILDTDFGAVPRTRMVGKDGYVFYGVDATGRIYNSDANAVQTWVSTNFLSVSEAESTYLQELVLYKNYIVAFTTKGFEVFEDVGNATGSPLQKVKHLTGTVGLLYNCPWYAIVPYNDSLVWLGRASNGITKVYTFDGYVPKIISSPELEILLNKTDATPDIDWTSISVQNIYGTSWLIISRKTPVAGEPHIGFNPETKEIITIDLGVSFRKGIIINDGASQRDNRFITASATGKVYNQVSLGATWQEDGSNTTVTIQTDIFDAGNKRRKKLKKIRLIGDKEASTTTVSVSWTVDDYITFCTARDVDMSIDDPVLTCGGIFRRIAFKLTNTSNTPLRLEALEIEYEELEH